MFAVFKWPRAKWCCIWSAGRHGHPDAVAGPEWRNGQQSCRCSLGCSGRRQFDIKSNEAISHCNHHHWLAGWLAGWLAAAGPAGCESNCPTLAHQYNMSHGGRLCAQFDATPAPVLLALIFITVPIRIKPKQRRRSACCSILCVVACQSRVSCPPIEGAQPAKKLHARETTNFSFNASSARSLPLPHFVLSEGSLSLFATMVQLLI